jgi:hypothetical protein
VIIPLMQGDAVQTYHWMTNLQFLNAVALGQVTPGPFVATVAAVGYAAHGIGGGLLAAAIAFAPSFSFVVLGGGRFERLRGNERARAFLDGAGPAAQASSRSCSRQASSRRWPRRCERSPSTTPPSQVCGASHGGKAGRTAATKEGGLGGSAGRGTFRGAVLT